MSVVRLTKKPKSNKQGIVESIKGIFIAKKGKNPHQWYPDDYFRRYWVDKKTSDGIDLVAATEQIPKRQAALNLIQEGFKHYLLEKTKQHIDNQVKLNQRGEDPVTGRFIKLLRRLAKQNGVDISKIL